MASAFSVTVGGFAFSLMHNNVGMYCTAKSIFDNERQRSTAQEDDVADMLPCSDTVRKSVQQACVQERLKLKDVLNSCMNVGGVVTSDSLTPKTFGLKYRDVDFRFVPER